LAVPHLEGFHHIRDLPNGPKGAKSSLLADVRVVAAKKPLNLRRQVPEKANSSAFCEDLDAHASTTLPNYSDSSFVSLCRLLKKSGHCRCRNTVHLACQLAMNSTPQTPQKVYSTSHIISLPLFARKHSKKCI